MSIILDVNPNKEEESNYFNVEKTISNTKLLKVLKSKNTSENNAQIQCDPFHGITQMSIHGFRFTRYNIKDLADGSTTYYYRCLNKTCNELARINVHKENFNYTLTCNENPHHSTTCKKCDEKEHDIIQILEQLKLYAQELFRNNNDETQKAKIKALIIQKYNKYLQNHPEKIFPILKSTTIDSWFNSVPTVRSASIKMSQIPIEIINLNGGWVYAELRKGDDYMLFLCFPKMKNLAKSATKLLLDGTFTSAPEGFYQVLNGVGYIPAFGRFCPLFHILLENQKQNTYKEALLFIFNQFEFTVLDTIHIDFELALYNILDSFFPYIEPEMKRKYLIQGCLFHFKQCLRKNFEALYGSDEDLDKYLRAFLLTPYISDSDFLVFLDKMKKEHKISDFYEYFQTNWGTSGRFPRALWKVSDKDPDAQITSDGVERYHHEVNKTINHPALEIFLKKLAELDFQIITNLENSLDTDDPNFRTNRTTPYEAKLQINEFFPKLLPTKGKTISSSIKLLLENDSLYSPAKFTVPFENARLVKESGTHKSRSARGKKMKKTSSLQKRINSIAKKEKLVQHENHSDIESNESEDDKSTNSYHNLSDDEISEIIQKPLLTVSLRKRNKVFYKDREFSEEESISEESSSSDSQC